MKTNLDEARTRLFKILGDSNLTIQGPPSILIRHETWEGCESEDLLLTIEFGFTLSNYMTLTFEQNCHAASSFHGSTWACVSPIMIPPKGGSLNKIVASKMQKSDVYFVDPWGYFEKMGVPNC